MAQELSDELLQYLAERCCVPPDNDTNFITAENGDPILAEDGTHLVYV